MVPAEPEPTPIVLAEPVPMPMAQAEPAPLPMAPAEPVAEELESAECFLPEGEYPVGSYQGAMYEGIVDYGDRSYLQYLLQNPACPLYTQPSDSHIREIQCGPKAYRIDYLARTVTRVGAPASPTSRFLRAMGWVSTAEFLRRKIFSKETEKAHRMRQCLVAFYTCLNEGKTEEAVTLAQQAPDILAMPPLARDPADRLGRNTLLHQLCKVGSTELVGKILAIPQAKAYLGLTDFTGSTPLMYLIKRPDMSGVLERSPALWGHYDVLDENGWSLIHHALQINLLDNCLAMLKHVPGIMAMRPMGGRLGDTIYHRLLQWCSVGQLAQISSLLGIADLAGMADSCGRTGLDIIIARGMLKDCACKDGVMRVIVTMESPPALFLRRDAEGFTPMHHALLGGCFWNCVTMQRCFPTCGHLRTRDGRSCEDLVMAQTAFTPQQKDRLLRGPR